MGVLVQRQGDRMIIPGFATAHSHAFQRALRARTQRRATGAGSFWSWRGLMYQLVERLDPDDLFNISRLAFAELAMSGVTAVGEFHYLHHAPGGTPYADRVTLSETVIRAARAIGLRVTLIRVAYMRAGYQQSLEPAQQRFADPSAETILLDVQNLAQRFAHDASVRVGLAAHSIRAVPREQVIELAAYAQQHHLPFHMHVAEQPGEVEASQQEYGMRPVELLAQAGVLHPGFVAVHATHLTPAEVRALGAVKAFVCLCRTTERDLGDGLPHTRALVEAGVRLCFGVDSHASSDAFEEIRAVEWDERSRTASRHVVADAPELLRAATQHGYQAIGFDHLWSEDKVYLKANDPCLAGIGDDCLTDAIIFAATPRAVDQVVVDGRTIVKDGQYLQYEEARRGYQTTLRKLGWLA
jgi:formimidoylglutamate deiminase